MTDAEIRTAVFGAIDTERLTDDQLVARIVQERGVKSAEIRRVLKDMFYVNSIEVDTDGCLTRRFMGFSG